MDITEHLIELADMLDAEGKTACVDAVETLIKEASIEKLAQYVGVIGYVLKQNRAIANCIRKKRVAQDGPMQEVVLDCLSEYQDGQQYDNDEWTSKYAEVIAQQPTLFSESHLIFLNSVAEENNIPQHLLLAKKSAAVLKTAGVTDEVINDVVDNIHKLAQILRKDTETNPFKVAAPLGNQDTTQVDGERGEAKALPQRRKNRWQQILYPTEMSWNPFSWSSNRRSTGDDQEALTELSMVAGDLYDISRIAGRMTTAMYRLKNQMSGYLRGSGEKLEKGSPPPVGPSSNPHFREDKGSVKAIADQIDQLNPNDWNKSMLAVHQLQWLLKDRRLRNAENQSLFDHAVFLAQDLAKNSEEIYQKLDNLQEVMSTLGQRSAIIGSETEYDQSGQPNPLAKFNPSEEFGVFEQLVKKFSHNPFDEAAQQQAISAYRRLQRTLRYMPNAEGQAAPQPEAAAPTGAPLGSPSETSSTAPPEAGAAGASLPTDNASIGRTADWLRSKLGEKGIAPETFIDLMQSVILGSDSGGVIPEQIRTYLTQLSAALRTGTPAPGEAAAPTAPTAPTPSAPRARPSSTGPSDEAVAGLAGAEREFGGTDSSRPLDFTEEHQANSIDTIVRIADIFDEVDPQLADVVDRYIASLSEAEFSLPEQPPTVEILKEKKGVAVT